MGMENFSRLTQKVYALILEHEKETGEAVAFLLLGPTANSMGGHPDVPRNIRGRMRLVRDLVFGLGRNKEMKKQAV